MSELVAVALITGGLTLASSLAAQWFGNRAERQRFRIQYESNLKAKLLDFEREDRLESVRPIRDYLNRLGQVLGDVAWEQVKQNRKDALELWCHRLTAHIVSGTGLTNSVGDGDLSCQLKELVPKVGAFQNAMRDSLLLPDGSGEALLAVERRKAALVDLTDVLARAYEALDHYARAVRLPDL